MKENTNTESVKRKGGAKERKDERKGKKESNVWRKLFSFLAV